MGQSDVLDPERTERRIRNLEREIAQRARANPQRGHGRVFAGGRPPQVSGLALLSSAPNTIAIEWNPVAVSDLLYYEVQVAKDAQFTVDVETLVAGGTTTYSYAADNSSTLQLTPYYLRVRAVNQQGNPGEWSARLNSTSGQVASADFTRGAAGEIYQYVKSSSFSVLNGDGETETYGPVTIDVFDEYSVVQPAVIFEYNFSSDWVGAGDCNMTWEFLRRPVGGGSDTVIDSVTVDSHSTIPTSGGGVARAVSPTFISYDAPGTGEWEYRIRVTVGLSGGNSLTFFGVDLTMEFIQSKRVL
jgi:hypothetical protein